MTPSWILNFTKKEQLGSFFEKYWQAQLTNDNELSDKDKWFYCMNCNSITDYDELLEKALCLTVKNGTELSKLIPCTSNQTKEIRIICLGDITDDITIEKMHFWMAKLRQNLLTSNPWTQVPSVCVYAILWRPETMTVGKGTCQFPKAKGFLNELNSLESLGINERPFHKVIFLQSGIAEEEQSVAFHQMELTALQMALSNGRFWDANKNDLFLNGGEAAVFYESKVQREQEAYTLSNLILDRFCHSIEPEFFDANEAHDYVEKTNENYFKAISAETIANQLIYQFPEVPISLSKPEMFCIKKTWSLSYQNIWFDFIKKHLGGFKARLLNNISWSLEDYENRYKLKVIANRLKYINEGSKDLEKKVFDIYAKETRLEHISIAQGREVVKFFRNGIKRVAQQSTQITTDPFPIPTGLRNALKQARDDYGDKATEKVLSVLDTKLRTLPAFNLAWFIRSLILGGLFGAIGHSLGNILNLMPLIIALLFGLIPLIYAIVSYLFHVKRINALKDQYVACRLDDIRKKLKEFIIEQVQQTYTDYDSFLQWVDKGKFEYLSKALSVLKPSDFSFEETPIFQPLLNYTLAIRGEDNKPGVPLSPVANMSIGEEEIKVSGSFGKLPILGGSPANQIQVDGEQKSLYDLMNENGYSDCQKLCKGLMDQTIDIANYQEKIVKFGGAAICCSKLLLLLDDSGSMSGQAIEDLKKVVLDLQARSEVEWIAFDHDLVSTSFDGGKLEDLNGGGGTCYVPAIKKAASYLCNNYADKVILISDDEPAEDINTILEAAKDLNQPLNTITISNFMDSNGVVDIMKEIAENTGGQQVTVESAADINITTTPEIAEMLQSMEGGNLPFYELMRKVHLTACAEALFRYTDKLVEDSHDQIINLIKDYGNKSGIKEWFKASDPTCLLSQTASTRTVSHLSIVGGFNNSNLLKWIDDLDLEYNTNADGVETNADMIAFIFSYQVIQLSDLAWAGIDTDDKSINNKDSLEEVMTSGYPLVNYFGNTIEFENNEQK